MRAFECAFCSATYEVEDSLAGKAIRCRKCNEFGKVSKKDTAPKPLPEALPVPTALPAQASPRRPLPWYFGFIETFSIFAIAIGALACVIGFVSVMPVVEKLPGAGFIALGVFAFCALGFLGILSGAAMMLVVRDAAVTLRRIAAVNALQERTLKRVLRRR